MRRFDFNTGWTVAKQGSKPQSVTLPHDAMLAEARSADAPSGTAGAFFPGGIYTYEKHFALPEDWQDQCVMFQFEGVYHNAKVTVNGTDVPAAPYGYTPFFVNVTEMLRAGENTVTVVADVRDQPTTRWYSGAGIYRPVWAWVGAKSHIIPEGVRVTTLSFDPAIVRVEVEATAGTPTIEILDSGMVAASGVGYSVELEIPAAKLWSADMPNLYTCRVTLEENGKIVDEARETFGIRTVTWSREGLFINGRQILLRGGCVHHDNGILGAATYAKSEERRVRIMKEAGYNAIRASHNPASKAMLEACDRLGMYMMDETWDTWAIHKNKYDYATIFMDHYKEDLTSLVRRDYNHPSVIIYSIGNEIADPVKPEGVALEKNMVELLHQLDSTRPVSAGINLMILSMASKGKGVYKEEGGMSDAVSEKPKKGGKPKKQSASGSLFFNMVTNMIGTNMNKMANGKQADTVTSPCLDTLDIAGYNYASGRYKLEGKAHPDRIIFGSETFPGDIGKNWAMVKQYPYLIGDFMWAAWDYIGEVGIGGWTYDPNSSGFNKPFPWLLADVGAIDIIGNAGAPASYAAAVWGLLDRPAIHVEPVNHSHEPVYKCTWRSTNARPTWAWQGCQGKKAVVEIYDSNAASIRLEINGKSVGTKRIKGHKAVFKTIYQPGTITAIALDATGKELSRSSLTSASAPLSLRLTAEDTCAAVGEIVYVKVDITGSNGVVESNADECLAVSVENGELLGFGSALPCTEDSYLTGKFSTYYGQALAVVRCTVPGTLVVHAKGEHLAPVQVSIDVKGAAKQ